MSTSTHDSSPPRERPVHSEAARGRVAELDARERNKVVNLPTDDPLDPKRRRRVELTRIEMLGQPTALRETLTTERGALVDAAQECARRGLDRIVLAGCGDSLACAVGVRALWERLLKVPCEPMQALDLAYYYASVIGGRTLVIVISASGASARAVEALLVARAQGATTVGVSNTPDSPLIAEAHLGIRVHAERLGWPTQSSAAAMAALAQFAVEIAKATDRGGQIVDSIEETLLETPEHVAAALVRHEQTMADLAARESEKPLHLFAAAGPAFACAMFGAAKVKEVVPNHALAIPLEEYHHYTSQRPGEPLFLIAPSGPSLARALDTTRRGRQNGGRVYAITTEGDRTLSGEVDVRFDLPAVPESLSPILYTVPLQLFAYHASMWRFRRAAEGATS